MRWFSVLMEQIDNHLNASRKPITARTACSDCQMLDSTVRIAAYKTPTTRVPHGHSFVHDGFRQALQRWKNAVPHTTFKFYCLHIQKENRQGVEHKAHVDLFLA